MPTARAAPGSPPPGAWRCSSRVRARPRKGEAKPSLAPASAEMTSRRARATNLSAKGPLAMACDRIGSVDVTQAPMMSAGSGPSPGSTASTHADVASHMSAITGTRHTSISRHLLRRYRAGSWYPAMTLEGGTEGDVSDTGWSEGWRARGYAQLDPDHDAHHPHGDVVLPRRRRLHPSLDIEEASGRGAEHGADKDSRHCGGNR